MKLLVVLFNIIIAIVTASTDSELLSVVVIFRHGDRTPKTFAPNDPYKDPKNWRGEISQLTNHGLQQHYELGKWFRNRYADFLPSKYVSKDIYVRSTDVDRCLMSAQANLAGLYPPKDHQIWNDQLLWRPIPIHTVPMKEDVMLELKDACPRSAKLYNDVLNLDEFKKIDKDNAELYAFLSDHLGVEITKFVQIEPYYDTMLIENMYGMELPEWAQKVFPEPMKTLSENSFHVETYNLTSSRFATGYFLDTIGLHFDAVINDSKNNLLAGKMAIFSAHQTNICDLSQTLSEFRSGSYASALIFELRNDTKPYINLFYKTDSDLETLNIRNCETNCDIEDFFEIIEPIRVNYTQTKINCEVIV